MAYEWFEKDWLDKLIEHLNFSAQVPEFLMFDCVAVLLATAAHGRVNYSFSDDMGRDDYESEAVSRVCRITERPFPTIYPNQERITSVSELLAFVGGMAIYSAKPESEPYRELIRTAIFETIINHKPADPKVQRECLVALGTFFHGFEAIALRSDRS
jgi:hypothetical protein